ncbi:hypothetical protein Q3V23_07110 [Streptomyces sp. VNUA116]|uniref:hypothetical protein n=1 Tax=Streptomyces sp. VNUA116 TaxID=3062449 RepID=UPI002676D84D|nr:hypothetical protein [Streptomyces sp. VNUA116]WKU43874.1 hypothetical protein Q3V23_07110 [Streptomyces sp. VNUA116]
MREHIGTSSMDGARPYTRSRPLPAYRGILAVDAKGFTGHPAIEHEAISRVVPELLETAFARAGLQQLWNERKFPATTGDGYVLGFDPSLMPFVIHPLLLTLQDVLTEFNILSHGAVPIRLRVSLHTGPLPDTGDEFSGNGTPRNDTHRLLDSRPVKAVLASHKESITHIGAILSNRCYEDAVASGYTGLHPDHFVEVVATVDDKPFAQQAWIYVPQPSGPLHEEGPADRAAAEQPREDARPPESRSTQSPHVRNSAPNGNINTGTLHGGQSVSNSNVAGDHVGGNKAGRVRGFQGDQVRGNKYQGRP